MWTLLFMGSLTWLALWQLSWVGSDAAGVSQGGAAAAAWAGVDATAMRSLRPYQHRGRENDDFRFTLIIYDILVSLYV